MAKQTTKFLILAALKQGQYPRQAWEEVATVEAATKEAALRSIGGGAGTYVAVPARSWQPVKLEVETIERVKLTAAAEQKPAPAEAPA